MKRPPPKPESHDKGRERLPTPERDEVANTKKAKIAKFNAFLEESQAKLRSQTIKGIAKTRAGPKIVKKKKEERAADSSSSSPSPEYVHGKYVKERKMVDKFKALIRPPTSSASKSPSKERRKGKVKRSRQELPKEMGVDRPLTGSSESGSPSRKKVKEKKRKKNLRNPDASESASPSRKTKAAKKDKKQDKNRKRGAPSASQARSQASDDVELVMGPSNKPTPATFGPDFGDLRGQMGPSKPVMGPDFGPQREPPESQLEYGPQMGPQLGPSMGPQPQEFGPQRQPAGKDTKSSFFRAALPVNIERNEDVQAQTDRNIGLWTGRGGDRGSTKDVSGPANRPRSPGKSNAGMYNKSFVFGRARPRR